MKTKITALVIVFFSLMISSSVFAEGYLVTSDLWIKAVINTVEKGPVDAVWQKGGEDTTSRGDTVIWGHFYASPSDVTWGSQDNPDLFVKIWFDVSGRIDVNFFHVSVPDIVVYSDYPYDGIPDEQGTTTMSRRYIRQYYEGGQSHSEENYEDGLPAPGYSPANNPFGYSTINNLRFGAMINTVEKGSVEAIWRLGGQDTTSRGDQVVWGHFYASPSDVTWGSEDNPDLFVKIWFDVSGRIDVNFFHVSVPDIEVYSDYPDDGTYDQKGTTIMPDRYIRHEYSSGGTTQEASATIGPSGGVIEVTDPLSPLYGIKLEIPAGALEKDTNIVISKASNPPIFGPELIPLSPVFSFKPEGLYFNLPIKITIPYDGSDVDENTLILPFKYAKSEQYWYTACVNNINESNIEILTYHFSHHMIAWIDKMLGQQPPPSYDTYFSPNMHGFRNLNTEFCAGMTSFAKWFFENHSECGSFFSVDEDTAEKIAKEAWSLTKEPDIWLKLKTGYRAYFEWEDFLYVVKREMSKSDSPIIICGRNTQTDQEHSILAYRYENDKIYAYDPNHPGEQSFLTRNLYNKDELDYFVVYKSEVYNPRDFEQLFNKYKDKICSPCANIAGTWNGCEEGTVTCIIAGETVTEEVSGCTTINIEQNGCEVRWETQGYERAGTIDGKHIHVSGILIAPVSGAGFTQNLYTCEGTIIGDKINFNCSGSASGTLCDEDGCYSFSCTAHSTSTMTLTPGTGTYKSSKTIKETDIPNGGPLFIFGITNSELLQKIAPY